MTLSKLLLPAFSVLGNLSLNAAERQCPLALPKYAPLEINTNIAPAFSSISSLPSSVSGRHNPWPPPQPEHQLKQYHEQNQVLRQTGV